LNEAYVEARLYARGTLANDADELYEAAREAIDTDEEYGEIWNRLKQARDDFIWSARDQLDHE
jgi:hypothetical protein